jgi:hypothetical protein
MLSTYSEQNTETECGQREGSDSSSSVSRSSSNYPCDFSRRRFDLGGGHRCDTGVGLRHRLGRAAAGADSGEALCLFFLAASDGLGREGAGGNGDHMSAQN